MPVPELYEMPPLDVNTRVGIYESVPSITHSDVQVTLKKVLSTIRLNSSGGSSEHQVKPAKIVIKAIMYFIFIPVLTLRRNNAAIAMIKQCLLNFMRKSLCRYYNSNLTYCANDLSVMT